MNVCNKILACGIKCTSCPTCNQTCPHFYKEQRSRLEKAPYACNGCDKKLSHCTIAHKHSYNGRFAHRKYHEILRDSRTGISITIHKLRQKDRIITPTDQGLFSSRNIDLKRKPKFRPRKCHKTQITDRSVFTGRIYLDFQTLGLDSYVEMDTVHSPRESKKVLLTLYFTREKLFLLMSRCTKGAVRLVFNHLEKRLGACGFLSLFEYMLTDRGSESGGPEALETGANRFERCNLYYCDPMRSGQKSGVENVHTMANGTS